MAKKNVPELRFRGFEEEWEEQTLQELADIYDGTHQTPNYIDSGIMFLSVENIANLHSNKYISQEDFENDFNTYPQKGDLLMTRIGDIGTVNVVESEEPLAYYVSLALLKPKNISSYFLKESMQSNSVAKEIWHRTLHIAFPKKINKNEIARIPVNHPVEDNEQISIGNLFKNLDALIAQHQRKQDKLIAVKKAMLEKMFPKEGAELPDIRFKGFAGKWKEQRISDLCSISTGKGNTQDKTEDGQYPFYVRSPVIERSKKYLYDEEAVLTVGDGVGTGKVFHYVNGKYDLHQRVYRMYGFNRVSGKYFYYYFSVYFYKRVMAMTAKTSVDSVRLEMISQMSIKFPTIEEQQKIVLTFEGISKVVFSVVRR